MARTQTISGEIVSITETKGGAPLWMHWYIISGTYQAIIDFLNENKIPEHKVKGTTLGSTCYVLFHK